MNSEVTSQDKPLASTNSLLQAFNYSVETRPTQKIGNKEHEFPVNRPAGGRKVWSWWAGERGQRLQLQVEKAGLHEQRVERDS